MAEKQTDPNWARNRKGHFHRLLYLRPDAEGLTKVGGVYVVWHGGLKPEWITLGKSSDLGLDLEDLRDNEDVDYYENRGGVFVTWARIKTEYQDGVLAYLIQACDLLLPPINTPAKDAAPIPVYPPGTEPRPKPKP